MHFANSTELTSSVRIPKCFVYLIAEVKNITILAKIGVISTAVLWITKSSPFIKGHVYNFNCICLAYFSSLTYWYLRSRNLRILYTSCQEWVLQSQRQSICLLTIKGTGHCLELLKFVWVNGIVRNTQKSYVFITELYTFSLLCFHSFRSMFSYFPCCVVIRCLHICRLTNKQ